MGNYLALCTIGEIQSKEVLLKEKRVLQIIKGVDGKILEFRNPVIVRDLLVSYPNSYVGIFKEATQALSLDHKLKIGKIYYLLPSLDHSITTQKVEEEDTRRDQKTTTTTTTTTTIKVVITKEQLQQILSKQGGVEELLLSRVVVPKNVLSSSESCSSSSIWFPKLESIPEGNDVVC
ncbi:hypothetical protein BVRB_000190 [Beta vulgaris subsp. vulgaris]|uniref:DUF4228 domain-containing protein n=1 Tax=Beta vulgaris subsp. vulgaris TaxID=3555 RepID=A0A0J8B5L9_BETVV|nr:hypothetical protein BVRB_000190 [Beta vulgaris subsp. vulgaris]